MFSRKSVLQIRKYLAWTLFWVLPLAIVLLLSQLLGGRSAQAEISQPGNPGASIFRPAEWQLDLPTPGHPAAYLNYASTLLNSSQTITITSGPISIYQAISPTLTSVFTITDRIVPQQAQVRFQHNHPNPAELEIVLTTPSGQNLPVSALATSEVTVNSWTVTLTSLGDQSEGAWTLTVTDLVPNENVGTLDTWELVVQGEVKLFATFLPILFGPIPNPPPPPTPTNTPTSTPTLTPTPTPIGIPPGFGTSTVTPTPTLAPGLKPTLTPTPTPTATPQPLPNGSFESGSNPWTEYSLKDYDLRFDTTSDTIPNTPFKAYDGDWLMWLGGDDDEISWVQRQVTVPAGRGYLGFYAVLQSYDSVCASDRLPSATDRAGLLRYASTSLMNTYGVDIGGVLVCQNVSGRSGCADSAVSYVEVSGYDLCSVPDTTGWILFLVPINSFNNQTVTVQFKAATDSQLSSSVYIDKVAWYNPILITSLAAAGNQVQVLQPVRVDASTMALLPDLPAVIKSPVVNSASNPDLYRKNR